MRYTVTTFKVGLEVSDLCERTASSEDVARYARPIFADLDADKEHFVLLALNNKHRVNGYKVISTGTLTASLIRPGDVYRAALHLAAAAVVFVHNHPSGDPAPSQEDVEITRRLKECGLMFAIRVLDHVILGADPITAFRIGASCDRLLKRVRLSGNAAGSIFRIVRSFRVRQANELVFFFARLDVLGRVRVEVSISSILIRI
jgi:proteasome lid subunit RPN8/RPN11